MNSWKEAYLGTALVAISALQPRIGAQKSLDQKKILELCRIYRVEGCRRLEEENRIRSVVARSDYDLYEQQFQPASRWFPGVTQYNGFFVLQPNSGDKITYVHGRHRLAAAQAYLLQRDHYWPVDFYEESASHQILTILADVLSSRS